MFNGPVTSGGQSQTPYDASGPSTYQIVLDTTTGNASSGWTVSFWEDGILQQGPAALASNPAYTGIFFENYLLGSDTWDNLLLTDSIIPAGLRALSRTCRPRNLCSITARSPYPYQAFATAPITYQWQFNGTNLTDNARISGALTNVLTIANVQTNDAGLYQVIATDSAGSVTSSVSTLIVGTLPVSFNGTNGVAWTGNSMSGAHNHAFPCKQRVDPDGRRPKPGPDLLLPSPAIHRGVPGGIHLSGRRWCWLRRRRRRRELHPAGRLRGPSAVVGPGNTLGVQGYPGAVANISPSAELVLNIYSPVGYSWNTNANVTSRPRFGREMSADDRQPHNVTLFYANGQLALTMTDTVARPLVQHQSERGRSDQLFSAPTPPTSASPAPTAATLRFKHHRTSRSRAFRRRSHRLDRHQYRGCFLAGNASGLRAATELRFKHDELGERDESGDGRERAESGHCAASAEQEILPAGPAAALSRVPEIIRLGKLGRCRLDA